MYNAVIGHLFLLSPIDSPGAEVYISNQINTDAACERAKRGY